MTIHIYMLIFSLRENSKEEAALLSFLETYNTIYDLGDISGRFNSKDVKYALRINHAGRSIVESRGNMKPLLLSMWPNLLEKAFESRKAKGPTGLHCLLRNGPALANRIGFCGGDGNAKEKNPNKRMITDVKNQRIR